MYFALRLQAVTDQAAANTVNPWRERRVFDAYEFISSKAAHLYRHIQPQDETRRKNTIDQSEERCFFSLAQFGNIRQPEERRSFRGKKMSTSHHVVERNT